MNNSQYTEIRNEVDVAALSVFLRIKKKGKKRKINTVVFSCLNNVSILQQ